ncbi:MAG: PepSY domain-containing protein [Gammaproteobacteria bacterium]
MTSIRKAFFNPLFVLAFLASAPSAHATGLATCDSGPQEGWQAPETLQERLEAEGWQVRRVKVDGGCYEVYALDANGERVEAYFHPVTLEPVPTEDEED